MRRWRAPINAGGGVKPLSFAAEWVGTPPENLTLAIHKGQLVAIEKIPVFGGSGVARVTVTDAEGQVKVAEANVDVPRPEVPPLQLQWMPGVMLLPGEAEAVVSGGYPPYDLSFGFDDGGGNIEYSLDGDVVTVHMTEEGFCAGGAVTAIVEDGFQEQANDTLLINIPAIQELNLSWSVIGQIVGMTACYDIAYSEELQRLVVVGYVTVSSNSRAAFSYSDDHGLTWSTPAQFPGTINGTWSRNIAYGNGFFVAVFSNFYASHNSIVASADGITWSTRSMPSVPTHRLGVGFSDGYHTIIGRGGGTSFNTGLSVCYSADGCATYAAEVTDIGGGSRRPEMAFSANGTHIISVNDSYNVRRSEDLVNWVDIPKVDPVINGGAEWMFADEDGVFVSGGLSGQGISVRMAMLQSTDDGLTWDVVPGNVNPYQQDDDPSFEPNSFYYKGVHDRRWSLISGSNGRIGWAYRGKWNYTSLAKNVMAGLDGASKHLYGCQIINHRGYVLDIKGYILRADLPPTALPSKAENWTVIEGQGMSVDIVCNSLTTTGQNEMWQPSTLYPNIEAEYLDGDHELSFKWSILEANENNYLECLVAYDTGYYLNHYHQKHGQLIRFQVDSGFTNFIAETIRQGSLSTANRFAVMNPDPSLELPAILPHEMNVRVVRKGGLFWVWVNNIPVTVGFDARDPQPYIEPDGVSKSLMLELSNFNSGASPVARSRISGLKIKPLQDEPTLLSIPATLTLRLRYFLRDSVKEGFITFSETGELSLSATNVLDAQLSVVQPEGLGDFSNPPEYTFPNYWIPAEFRNAPWRVNPEDFEIFFDKPDESESTWRGMDFSGVGFAAGQWVGMEVARTIRYHWPNTISGTSSGRSIRISIRRKDSGLMVLTNARIVVEVWDTT